MKEFSIPENFVSTNKEHVYLLQQGLAFLGYGISAAETDARLYGEITIAALQKFQTKNFLPVSPLPTAATIAVINNLLENSNVVWGYVKNMNEIPVKDLEVIFFTAKYDSVKGSFDYNDLGSVSTLEDGSYRFYHKEPVVLSSPLCIAVDVRQGEELIIEKEKILVTEKEHIFNINSGAFKSNTDSTYRLLTNKLAENNIYHDEWLKLTPKNIVELSSVTGFDTEAITKLILSKMVVVQDYFDMTFGILYQNYPTNMPIKLFTEEVSQMDAYDWETYLKKVADIIYSGLLLLPENSLGEIILNAFKENYISGNYMSGSNHMLLMWRDLLDSKLLSLPLLEGEASLDSLLSLAPATISNNPEAKKEIGKLFVKNIKDFSLFIETVGNETYRKKYTSQVIDRVIYLFMISRITRNYIPVIVHLYDTYPYEINVKNLLENKEDFWFKVLQKTKYPEDFESDKEYTAFIMQNLRELYPEEATLDLLSESGKFSHIDDIKSALDKYPDKNLLSNRVEDFNIEDDNIEREMRTIQQVYRITPNAEATKALLKCDIVSAGQVYHMGKEQLTKTLAAELKQSEIDKIYEAASARYGNALIAYTTLNSTFFKDAPAMTQKYNIELLKKELGNEFPDIEALFGSTDYCECSHDNSVYGAPAYLLDLLTFLDDRKSEDTRYSVRDFLDKRRPDISNIYLNAQNTNTMLPYIDLVCEVLEEAVLQLEIPKYKRDISQCQTTLETKQLLAFPEHILSCNTENGEKNAYDMLLDKVYPLFASFDLYHTEIRAYLDKMGIKHHELMKTFQVGNDASEMDIAAEYFEMTRMDKEIITARYPEDILFQGNKINIRNDAWRNGGISNMSIENFKKDSGLSTAEVLDILASDWIGLTSPGLTAECSTKGKVIKGDSYAFDRAHRFIRFWKKSGWKMWELNMMLKSNVAVQEGGHLDSLNEYTLCNFKKFREEQQLSGLSCDELLVAEYEENINIYDEYENGKEKNCLYDRIFLNAALSNPVSQRLKDIKAGNTFTPDQTDKDLLAASLTLKKEDFDELESLIIDPNSPILDLATLSRFFKLTIILKKTGLSAKEYKIWSDITGQTSLTGLVAALKDVREFPLTMEDYQYLTSNFSGKENPRLNREEMEPLIEKLKISVEGPVLPEFTDDDLITDGDRITATTEFKDQFKQFLMDNGIMSSPEKIEEILQFTECSWYRYDKDGNDITEKELPQQLYPLFPNILNLPKVYILGNLYPYPNADNTNLKERYNLMINYYNMVSKAIGIQNAIAGFYDISMNLVENTFFTPVSSPDSFLSLLEFIMVNDFSNTTEIEKIITALHQYCTLIKKSEINEEDIITTIGMSFSTNIFPWNKIFDFSTSVSFVEIMNLLKMSKIQTRFGKTSQNMSLFSGIIESLNYHSNMNEFLDFLSRIKEWNLNEIKFIREYFGWNDKSFYLPETYEKLEEYFRLRDLTGVSKETLIEWSRNATGTALINKNKEIKDALKTRYENDRWLEELPALQKPIREAKSHALASYLIAVNPSTWKDKKALYNHFLLDTEMSACMKTSRIVQATNSIQLFVQRCSLNLEENITVDDTNWKQWEWMKKYRLWEANRKIFLYPENWIEPELRDDKTPFFKELEDELNQNEVTDENVETVFENYLQKMNEVSNLFICGVYREEINYDDGITENSLTLGASKECIMHVIGRTQSIPYTYYYRNYDVQSQTWSHWENVELDISSDTVFPMVYNRKLHLFWIAVTEKSISPEKEGESSIPYSEIQLCWSTKKNNKWKSVNRSQKKHLFTDHRPISEYSLMARYNQDRNEIELDLYLSNYPKNTEDNNSQLSGIFFFNGNVYRTISMCEFITSARIQPLRFVGYNEGSPTIADIINHPSSRSINEKSKTALAKMDEESRPDPVIARNRKDVRFLHDYSYMLASHLYPTETDDNGRFNVYLNRNTPEEKALLLNTGNRNPNFLFAFHNSANLWYGIRQSHLYSHFFYQDSRRSFFIAPPEEDGKYTFSPFYHPYTNLFIKELNRAGIPGLMNRNIQVKPENYAPRNTYDFFEEYQANTYLVSVTSAKDVVDFNLSGAYSGYNWELFFHTPLYIACKLSQNQKYEEAMKWFHYIFDPTDKSKNKSPQKFWITKPFFLMSDEENSAQQIRDILKNIEQHAAEVNAWLNDPYKPHLVARTRPVAYQRTVVMKYIDNLIAWADQLFRQDTMEANNEATLLYMLAAEILGPRPVMLPENSLEKPELFSYNKLKNTNTLNRFKFLERQDSSIHYSYSAGTLSNSIAAQTVTEPGFYLNPATSVNIRQAKGYVPQKQAVKSSLPVKPLSQKEYRTIEVQGKRTISSFNSRSITTSLPRLDADHFCIPFNDNLLGLWDIVEDRLFKLRNCMNIEGIVRELPLFEPPIDPAMLVKAAAAGLSIGDVLNDITAPQPYYRFRTILQKAVEFTGEVKQLGDKLLSALEKKDAESLNILRSTQEINMQKAIKQVRKLQINEAKENIANIETLIRTATAKKIYYESREFMNHNETLANGLGIAASVMYGVSNTLLSVASTLHAIPTFQVGFPCNAAISGGQNAANVVTAISTGFSGSGQIMDRDAARLSTLAGYQRRQEEWTFQAQMAEHELEQLNKQLTASEIRLMMAEKELENLEMQIEQSQSIKEYYQDKYTNEALYNWMITQLSTVYFQAYKLAYDMAKKAENCYRHELGIYDFTNFIQFGYWDSLKKGLLSGDRLIHDLHNLEADYLNKNKRTMELTKHISLAQMFPEKLINLVSTKETALELGEFLFDMDYPGHYMRRIKSVSVTIPNVSGPYSTVSFMLTLTSAKVRKNNRLINGSYPESPIGNDSRFVYQTGGSITQSICTSSAQNDSGLFELNFGDERYLPFENAGVISSWKLEFPAGCDQIDLSTVSDVILHIHYTSLYDGNLKKSALDTLEPNLPTTGSMLLSLKQQFPDEWNAMGNETDMKINLQKEHLPYFLRSKFNTLKTARIIIMMITKKKAEKMELVKISAGTLESVSMECQNESSPYIYTLTAESVQNIKDNFGIKIYEDSELINPNKIEDIIIGFQLG